MPIGKASYQTKKAKTNFWALKPKVTSLVLRILPPLGKLCDSGKWWQYCSVHWSQEDSNGHTHPFQCVEERNRKQVTVACPMCVKHAEIEAEYQNKKAAGIDEKHLELLADQMFKTDVTRGYYMNVMNLKGEFGVFRISRDLKDVMEAAFEKVRTDPKRALDPIEDGVFFEFSRTGRGGMGGKVNYKVDAFIEILGTTVVNGEVYEKHDVKHEKMTEGQIRATESPEFTGRDLSDIAPKIDYSDVALLATGDTTTVDRVFGTSKRANYRSDTEAQTTTATPPPANATAATPPPAAPTAAAPPVVTAAPVAPKVEAAPAAVTTPVAGKPIGELQKLTETELLEMFKTDGLDV